MLGTSLVILIAAPCIYANSFYNKGVTNKRAYITIFILVATELIGFGLIIPILPQRRSKKPVWHNCLNWNVFTSKGSPEAQVQKTAWNFWLRCTRASSH